MSVNVPRGVRVAFGALALILAFALVLFRPPTIAMVAGSVGATLVFASAFQPRASWILGGTLLYAASTIGFDLPRFDSLPFVLFVLAVAVPVLILVALVPRLDADALPGRFPTGRSRYVAWLVISAPLLAATGAWFIPAVRDALHSDLGPVLAVFVLGGAAIATWARFLLDGEYAPTAVDADPLTPPRPVARANVKITGLSFPKRPRRR